MKNSAEMILADSETDANLYYATRFVVPDPVFFFRIRGRKYLLLNDLEVDRGRKEAEVDSVLSLSEWEARTRKKMGKPPTSLDIVAEFLKEKKVKSVILPYNFPAFYASAMSQRKIKVSFRPDPFWQTRLYKTLEEKKAIRESLKHTGKAIQKAYEALGAAKIKNGSILMRVAPHFRAPSSRDRPLPNGKSVPRPKHHRGRRQSVVDPTTGVGETAQQAIVMDVFPRSLKSQYYADMTRTVVKGKPSPVLKKIWHAVKEAQEWAIGEVREGIHAPEIHDGILKRFESKGFKTGKINGRMQGFFHGTGHGLGLDIHEPPRVSKSPVILKEGMVVTVEPGLYYQGIGGVRIEDVVYVTKRGCEVLSSCPKILAIP
jgi:Xaa-Pro aminopeptidase